MTYNMLSQFSNDDFQDYDGIMRFQYNVIGCINGHTKEKGKTANITKNPIWIIKEDEKEYLLMYCEVNTIVKLCKGSYQKILDLEKIHNTKITWHKHSNGYIQGHISSLQLLYIHQVIMDCYGYGKGTALISVDHIDRDPLNNTFDNLRLATREEQGLNSKGTAPGTKRERQCIARPLPEGIDQQDIPKYITYNVEVWDKTQNKTRDFFRVEGHPLISPKKWESTSSSKISAADKLKQTIKVLEDMDAGILPTINARTLPKHVYLGKKHGKPVLQYDNRSAGITKSMTIQETNMETEEMQQQLYIFNYKIMQTFGEEYTIFDENYSYMGNSINIFNEILEKSCSDRHNLPKHVSVYNETRIAYTILAFQKQIDNERITKKITLNKKYDLTDDNIDTINELSLDLQDKISILNKEIITKWGIAHAILETSEIAEKEIQKAFQDKCANGLPTNVHTKIQNGDLYMEFNKVVLGKRMNTTVKLPKNYNKNKELHRFNEKITQLYGDEHGLNLDQYPYDPEFENEINIPDNMYINLSCKNPYLFMTDPGNNNITKSWKLPETYDLQEQIEEFNNKHQEIANDPDCDADGYKQIYDSWKPDNISIIMKDGKPVLAYQKRCNDYKHGLTLTLPRTMFNMNKQLIEINKKIIAKYGQEFSVLQGTIGSLYA